MFYKIHILINIDYRFKNHHELQGNHSDYRLVMNLLQSYLIYHFLHCILTQLKE